MRYLYRLSMTLALIVAGLCLGGATELRADPPPGYYDPALGLTGASLKQALHAIIDDHTRLPYTSSSTDTWDVLALAHADPAIPSNVTTWDWRCFSKTNWPQRNAKWRPCSNYAPTPWLTGNWAKSLCGSNKSAERLRRTSRQSQ